MYLFFFAYNIKKTSAYNFALLIVPPIPIFKISTTGPKKNKGPAVRVQHIILASQMINLGFLVGLFTYNARLAKSHVVMSCKLFLSLIGIVPCI